jgi:glycine/D-amino acid oxidase-like deaminating enzyme
MGTSLRSPVPAAAAEVPRTADLVVVGAGAMGAWTAYWAAAGGAGPEGNAGGGGRQVLLLDAWGTGHPRATSGDETRIIRSAHGPNRLYTTWARRAREHWRRFGEAWEAELLVQTGVLWFAHRAGGFEDTSADTFELLGVPHERLGADELMARWPQLDVGGGLTHALYEPEGGTLMARRGCQAVTAAFQRAGGTYGLAGVHPGRSSGHMLLDVVDSSGRSWSAGSFVFAAGPWLPYLFPDLLGQVIRVTKQDVVFIGPREGDRRFRDDACPAWVDYDAGFYGMPATDDRGFKLAPDRLGPVFDPSNGERVVDPDSVRLARRYLAQRFPALATGPVVETRVCQYESTVDGHFLIARHPALENVWLVGGGSGHGYKHGPCIGEYVVSRLDGAAEGAWFGRDEERFRIGPRSPEGALRAAGDDMARTWDLF